jgi:3-hydroxybutyrate dehydrogenase
VAAEVGGVPVVADLSDVGGIDQLRIDVDIVVNNAGLQYVAPVEDFPPERFEYLHRVMLQAPFRLVRQALPGMYARGWGRIVNISSVHGLRASAYKSAYVSAKHGLEGFTKVVAIEGAAHGVTANCVSPGYVRTPLVEGPDRGAGGHPRDPGGRGGGEDHAGPVGDQAPGRAGRGGRARGYLCSPVASAITGSSITMDGGWSAQ